MTYETILSRGHDKSLRAKTIIPLGFDRRELHVLTSKGSRGAIVCAAQCVQVAEDGRSFSFILFGDFRKTLANSPARCTEKELSRVHAEGLAGIEACIAECRAFYAKQAADHAEPIAA